MMRMIDNDATLRVIFVKNWKFLTKPTFSLICLICSIISRLKVVQVLKLLSLCRHWNRHQIIQNTSVGQRRCQKKIWACLKVTLWPTQTALLPPLQLLLLLLPPTPIPSLKILHSPTTPKTLLHQTTRANNWQIITCLHPLCRLLLPLLFLHPTTRQCLTWCNL